MLNREDHDLLSFLVDQVINEIAVFGGHEFADAFDILGTTDRRFVSFVIRSSFLAIDRIGPRWASTSEQLDPGSAILTWSGTLSSSEFSAHRTRVHLSLTKRSKALVG
jgi:hypothetical protein